MIDPSLNAGAVNFQLRNDDFPKAWARRKTTEGSMYGHKFINDCKDEIASFFNHGVRNSSEKNDFCTDA